MKSAPKGLTLGVKADIERNSSICPKLAIIAKHYDLVFSPMQKKRIPSNLGGQFATLGLAGLPAFDLFLSITCVLSTQMESTSPF
jgi:hypothetical protein